MSQPERVNLGQLDTQQLLTAQRNIDSDIQRFAESLSFLNKSAQLYHSASAAVKQLAEAKEGQELLLPLTQSLYVNGTVASTEQVLVDIGTGYFVEMTTEQGQEYYKRRVDKIKANMDEVQKVLSIKQGQLLAIEKELASRRGQPPA